MKTPHQNEGKIRAVLDRYRSSIVGMSLTRGNPDEFTDQALTAICDEMEHICLLSKPKPLDSTRERRLAHDLAIREFVVNLKAALAKERGTK